jgi:hypothetical protein
MDFRKHSPFIQSPTVAGLISLVANTARLSLSVLGFTLDATLSTATAATSASFRLYRSFLVGALSLARISNTPKAATSNTPDSLFPVYAYVSVYFYIF